MGKKNKYGVVTDREKREKERALISAKFRNYTDEEVEAALERRLQEKNNSIFLTTAPLPAKRETLKMGTLSRNKLNDIINPKIKVGDVLNASCVFGLLAVLWFLFLFMLWASLFFKRDLETFFVALLLGVTPVFLTYTSLRGRKRKKRISDNLKDRKIKVTAYKLVDMAREDIGTESKEILCYLFMKPLSGGKTETFYCEYKDYSRFREGDIIFCVYVKGEEGYDFVCMFREEEWDYDQEMEKHIERAKLKSSQKKEKATET